MKFNQNQREKKFYYAIVVVLVLYLILSNIFDRDIVTKTFTTSTTLIAAVAFWLQFKRTESINESNFILNMNNQFINNKSMTEIEHYLELFYTEHEMLYTNKGLVPSREDLCDLELELNLDRRSMQRQQLIDYLVYLEALSALIERNVLHMDVIDNLFSYRFFLAINNPIVQEAELFPYAT